MIGSVAKTMQYSVRQGRRQVEDGRPDHTEKIGSMERKLRRRNGGDHIQNCLSNVACCRYNERIVSFLKKKMSVYRIASVLTCLLSGLYLLYNVILL